jgi:hypothetical protein
MINSVWLPRWVLAASSFISGCGPHHHDGGSGGSAGEGASAGEAGSSSGGIAGSGGVAGSGTAGVGGAAGAGGTEGQLGYDIVVGCPAATWPAVATFTVIESPSGRFIPSKLSGDGRVVGGALGPEAMRWRPGAGFNQMNLLEGIPRAMSCDGSVAAVYAGGGVWHDTETDGARYIFGYGSARVDEVNISPDGSVITGNLVGSEDEPGPAPVRWTWGVGAQVLGSLVNSIVYHVSPDGQALLGADILQVYRWSEASGKRIFFWQAPLGFDGPPIMPVSADGNVIAFTSRSTLTSMLLFTPERGASLLECPGELCAPISVSGTGKVVLLWSTESQSLVWTEKHGFRSLTQLVQEYGGDTQGYGLSAHDMSDDGQVFTGLTTDGTGTTGNGFYVTLPAAAYE